MRNLFAAAVGLTLVSACSVPFMSSSKRAPELPSAVDVAAVFVISERDALQAVRDSLTSSALAPVRQVRDPAPGYSMKREVLFRDFNTVLTIHQSRGFDNQGRPVVGFYPRVSGNDSTFDAKVLRLARRNMKARASLVALRAPARQQPAPAGARQSGQAFQPPLSRRLDLPAPAPDIAGRLRLLKKLADEGLITAEEYKAKRSDILGQL